MTTVERTAVANRSGGGTPEDDAARIIDSWFPCAEVDAAVGTPTGSGLSEKALFTWYASRPIAQARAAVLCSLLPDTPDIRRHIRSAVRYGDESSIDQLRAGIAALYDKPPVVLDMFSGRGIIPLEAARFGAASIGTDYLPVATLAGRLLADYPLRDWSPEPQLPFFSDGDAPDDEGDDADHGGLPSAKSGLFVPTSGEPRLLADVRSVLAEVGRRVREEVADLYPANPAREGQVPWAYVWAVTIPCDGCRRRFPLIGSMALRHPYHRTDDAGQAMRLVTKGDEWRIDVVSGVSSQTPTFASTEGKPGKTARCPFPDCGTVHSLAIVKAKGFAGQYEDAMLAVAEPEEGSTRKVFRVPRADEVEAASLASQRLGARNDVPDEQIAAGNTNTIQASLFGYQTYASLMNDRQLHLFAVTAATIREIHAELSAVVSGEYAAALAAYAAAVVPRQLRYATRGSGLRPMGKSDGSQQNRVKGADVYSTQSVIRHQFDYLETGATAGPGTWPSISKTSLNALRAVLAGSPKNAHPARVRQASAVALPLRDGSVDALVTDPPYYDMITYADSSDLAYVWLKRALATVMPDLFDGRHDGPGGLQDNADEIIVKSKGRRAQGEHRTVEFYEAMLARSFREAKRVLKADGHLTVVFGHADPEAWKRLLAALTTAGFVVTSSWPSRTETAVTGVATISVTVSIGARVARAGRPIGIASSVDAEVVSYVKQRCKEWDSDGLAIEDQLMASYGAALTVVGRYSNVVTPAGEDVPLEHYMGLARRAVRDAVALRLDDLPLDSFDPYSRLAIFWHTLYGRDDVPKGEARFFAQSDDLRLEDLRGPILHESTKGLSLRHDGPDRVTPASSTFEVVRAMAAAWTRGTDSVATVLADADRAPTDPHVWAVVNWLGTRLPAGDMVAKQLAAIQRNRSSIQASTAAAVVAGRADDEPALTLFSMQEQP